MQNVWNRYSEILKYHGPFRGVRRVADQIMQVELYDWIHSTQTREMLSGTEFLSALGDVNAASAMHYQPAYTATIKRPLLFLTRNFPIIGAPSACFLDLGCGSGKVLHIAGSSMSHVALIGIDIHPLLLNQAAQNLNADRLKPSAAVGHPSCFVDTPKLKLLRDDVNEVAYGDLLSPYDVVIVHNKNSFDKKTTARTMESIREACSDKALFYIYNNPVFEEIFAPYPCVFAMSGWHKNWNVKVFKLS